MKHLTHFVLIMAFGYAVFTAGEVYKLMQRENVLRYDQAEIHMIKHGLFNLELWKTKLFDILEDRIDDFEITKGDLKAIRVQIERYLEELYVEYFESGKLLDAIVEARQGASSKEKQLGSLFVGLFRKNIEKELQNIDFRAQIPIITSNLMVELERKIPDIKESISRSVSDMVARELASGVPDYRTGIYEKYGQSTLAETDQLLRASLDEIALEKKSLLTRCLSALGLALLTLLFAGRFIGFRPSISWLTALCTVFLALGVALPMIDLDARLSSMDVQILGENIHFDEQVMYFQSKSIIDVTRTLLDGRGLDLKIVGLLILLFSIILPFLKLLLTSIYIYMKKTRNSQLVRTIIFYMGKWSMADVFVVAIFMSYIGFYGLLSSMLADFSSQSHAATAETVNYSKLSAGIIFFTGYCILTIIMSSLVHRRLGLDDIKDERKIVGHE